jgi:hypothetical protein
MIRRKIGLAGENAGEACLAEEKAVARRRTPY